MRRTRMAESRRDRMAVANDAGVGTLSLVSVLAGVLVAYGAFGVMAAVAVAVLRAAGIDASSFSRNDWHTLGTGGAVLAGCVLLISYLFGGYVAGRMARRAGGANGLFVFILGILLAVGVGAAVGSQGGSTAVMDHLRSLGVPTRWSEWSAIGTAAGAGSLLAMLLGSLFGGMKGERWHGKLVTLATTGSQVEPIDLRSKEELPLTNTTSDPLVSH